MSAYGFDVSDSEALQPSPVEAHLRLEGEAGLLSKETERMFQSVNGHNCKASYLDAGEASAIVATRVLELRLVELQHLPKR